MSLSKPSSRKCYYELKVQELRELTRNYSANETMYAKALNMVRGTSPKQKRVDQLLGSGYGWQAIYEKLISEGYYK